MEAVTKEICGGGEHCLSVCVLGVAVVDQLAQQATKHKKLIGYKNMAVQM